MVWKSGGGWNYRVLRYKDGEMGIHEVFYDNGKPTSCTENAVGVVGENLTEMRKTLGLMTAALEAPALDREAIIAGTPSSGSTGEKKP
jgi:hypothetical protein